MADTANLFPSSPFDALPGGGFGGGEGFGGGMPSLPAGGAGAIGGGGFDASSVTAQPVPVGRFDYMLPATYGAESVGTMPSAPSAPAPYNPPGGGYMAPPDVTVAAGPQISPAQMAQLTGGAVADPYTGEIVQGSDPRLPAVQTATAPPPAAPAPAPAAPAEQPPPSNEGWTLTPQGAQATAAGALAKAGVSPTTVPGDTGPMGWLARNILDPYKKSGIGELAGIGIPAAGLISQLLKMQGGQVPFDPTQQQRLQLAQQQANLAQQYMTGQIPQGTQMTIEAKTKANIQQIKSRYAQLGMSGSTAEAQDIANAQATGARDLANAQTQIIAAGASMMGIPQQQLQSLTREQLAQDAAFSDALAKFVAGLSAGPAQTKVG